MQGDAPPPISALLTPNVAIEWGFNLFLADNARAGTEIQIAAARALREIEALIECLPNGTPEGAYATMLRMASTGFARGIERRKKDLGERREAIRQAKEARIARFGRAQRFGGLARGGIHLLLVGGFAYALVFALFDAPILAHRASGVDREYASLASALGAGLIGAFFRDWWIQRRLLALFKDFEEAFERANKEYVDSVVAEYQFAAETASNAWRQLTGTRPPVTPAFERLLINVMRGPESIGD